MRNLPYRTWLLPLNDECIETGHWWWEQNCVGQAYQFPHILMISKAKIKTNEECLDLAKNHLIPSPYSI